MATKIILNPDKETVKFIKGALKKKNGYCPCILEANEDTKCMCKQFREMTEGICHCGLYIKVKENE